MTDRALSEQAIDKVLREYADQCHGLGKYEKASGVLSALKHVLGLPAAEVVSLEQNLKLNFQCNVLKALLRGEWVDCNDVQEALNITFDQGMRMFDFGRTASWNPIPLEGQKVTVKFRIGEKTLEQTKMHDFEEDFKIQEAMTKVRSNPNTHQLEVLLSEKEGDM